MNDRFQCGDPGALVAFLYDECEPGERDLIAAHVRQCASCASEIESLGATRRTLASWTPPEMELGFQITRRADAAPAPVLQPTIAWWRAPMPAWAQVAAALMIFAAGLSAGLGSSGQAAAPETPSAPETASAPQTASAPPTAGVSQDALAQVEQRLKSELARLRPSSAAAAPESDEAVIQQVKDLIAQSAADERRDFTLRMVKFADALERQRRVELSYYDQTFGQVQGVAREQIQQRDAAFYEAVRRAVSVSNRQR